MRAIAVPAPPTTSIRSRASRRFERRTGEAAGAGTMRRSLTTRSNAATTVGSNWVPAPAFTSASAVAAERPAR